MDDERLASEGGGIPPTSVVSRRFRTVGTGFDVGEGGDTGVGETEEEEGRGIIAAGILAEAEEVEVETGGRVEVDVAKP